jgi:acetyl esterase/lipase
MLEKTMNNHKKHPLYKILLKCFAWLLGVVVFIAIGIYVAFQVSPWPSALLLRDLFDKNAAAQTAALQKHLPSDVTGVTDVRYKSDDADALLDAYYPKSVDKTDKTLPTIVWVHGGGWISGNKGNVADYLKILASKGYTTIGINYSLAPEKHYPTPVIQTNEALAFINKYAATLHADTNQIILAGDSAGSQIASQIAAITTNPDYAKIVDVIPALTDKQIVGMLLSCGAYDVSIINTDGNSQGAKLLKTFLWSYSGNKDFLDDPSFDEASVIDYVTKDFPPSFITAGNNDPLLSQSQVMAKKLKSLGVTVDSLFYPTNYTPALPHEYQFNLDNAAGQKALAEMESFLKQHTSAE